MKSPNFTLLDRAKCAILCVMRTNQRKTIVIGHLNPDTDSIVSAIAYAALKRQQGNKNCIPARAGKLSPQTEYILQRFDVHPPKFIPDMFPKVEHFLPEGKAVTVQGNTALWDALELMDKEGLTAVPVVDRDGHYLNFLSHHSFAESLIHKSDPHRKAIIPTSISLLTKTLRAQPLLTFDADTVVKSRLLVAGCTRDAFEQVLKTEMPTNAIAVVENRESIIKLCLQYKVRAIVITSALPLSREMFIKAKEAQISVLISPYDITSTIYLALYSMPVSCMVQAPVKPVKASDSVRDILRDVQNSYTRSLPVINDNEIVIGSISEPDIYREPNTDIIMVDHNELSLAVQGLDQFRIIEVIDHHKLNNFPTKNPITFINRVVGATATVVACLYQEQKAIMTAPIAGLLLSAIITDTLGLQSPTTTDVDRNTADYLAGLLNLDVTELAQDIFSHAARLTDLSAEKLISMDSKAYAENGLNFTVAQIETGTTNEIHARLPELLAALEEARQKENLFFKALMVTDIVALNSILLVAGEPRLLGKISFPKVDGSPNIFLCRGIMSRKKQLLPLLMELIEGETAHGGR